MDFAQSFIQLLNTKCNLHWNKFPFRQLVVVKLKSNLLQVKPKKEVKLVLLTQWFTISYNVIRLLGLSVFGDLGFKPMQTRLSAFS